MYRIPAVRPKSGSLPPASVAVEAGRFRPQEQAGNWSLFVPLHYEPGYAYPLLVWLHGPGDDPRQLLRVMPCISLRNYAAVAPCGSLPVPAQGTGYMWPVGSRDAAPEHGTEARSASPAGEANEALAEQAEQAVWDAIDAAGRALHLSKHRVFLVGFDQGGSMALELALAHPDRFAGVISLGGALPRRPAILTQWQRARRLPLLLACGRESRGYAPAAACEDLRMLHQAGMQAGLRIYAGGQQLGPEMLADVNRWLMQRVTGQPLLVADLSCQ